MKQNFGNCMYSRKKDKEKKKMLSLEARICGPENISLAFN